MVRFIICARARVRDQFGVSGIVKIRNNNRFRGKIMVMSYVLIRVTSRVTYILC